jgi:hypothetical protein
VHFVAGGGEIDVEQVLPGRPWIGRDSSLVSEMPRRANTLSALNSDPGSFGSVKTIDVLSATRSAAAPPTTRKRVMLSSKSCTEAAARSGRRPRRRAPRRSRRRPSSPASATILALPAVS